MLSFTTLRHGIFVKIPKAKAEGTNVYGYSVVVDGIVDELASRCLDDADLLEAIGSCKRCDAAYPMMADMLTEKSKKLGWLSENLSSIYRRVLFVLYPDRFGFERTGWDW